MEIRDIDNAYV